MGERKANQERCYNKGTRELVDLQPGDTARIKPLLPDSDKLWKISMKKKKKRKKK